MVPPVQVCVAWVQAPPLPVTLSPALVPVLVITMPLDGLVLLPVTLILRNVRPLAPMVVFATLSAVPVVVVSVLTIVVLFCVAVTVPPPVAVKALFAPVDNERPPVNATVAPLVVIET